MIQQQNSTLSEQIYRETRELPEPIAREVLDFIGYLRARYDDQAVTRDLISAQEAAMRRVWENTEDEVWNDL